MALSEFRDTHSWREAIELGPQLVRLAEDLPGAEQMGLSLQLREAMVGLPAAIAVDLLEGGSYTRKPAMLRLVAMLDLIEKIYPALDTAEVRSAVDKLAERIASDKFGEQTAGAATAYLPGAAATTDSNGHPAASSAEPTATDAIAAAMAAPAPASVVVVPEAIPAAPAEPALKVPVTAGAETPQENHVQPDSRQ